MTIARAKASRRVDRRNARSSWDCRRGAALVLGLLLAVLAPVNAERVMAAETVARDYLLDAPRLAGGEAYFMTSYKRDGYAIRRAAPGLAPQTVAHGREPGKAEDRRYSFDVAPGRFALQASRLHGEWDSASDPSAGAMVPHQHSRLLAGRWPSQLTPLTRCVGEGSSFPYAVGSEHVVFVDHCGEFGSSAAPQLNYVDFSAGVPVRRSLRLSDGSFEGVDSIRSLQVAGPWAAANANVNRGGRATVVFDLRSGAEAYRVGRVRAPYPAPFDEGTLDADGTLVMRSGDTGKCQRTLAFYTPAEPRPHPLPYETCGEVVIERDRLLFLGRWGSREALLLGDLTGSAAKVVAVAPRRVLRRFELEGERALYELETCGLASAIRVAPLPGAAADEVKSQRCPIRLASHRARLRPGGRLAVRLRCRRGCGLWATLQARVARRGAPRLLRTVDETSLGTKGPTALLRFKLGRKTRSRLPDRFAARLTLRSDQPGALRSERIRTTILVQRGR